MVDEIITGRCEVTIRMPPTTNATVGEMMEHARIHATSSIDVRARVGAVLAYSSLGYTKIGAGYNYNPPGYDCAKCPRVTQNIQSGHSLERCFAVHAEQAAIFNTLRYNQKHVEDVWHMFVVRLTGYVPDGPNLDLPILDDPIFTCSVCARIMYAGGVDYVWVLTRDGPVQLTIAEALRTSFEYAGIEL